MKKRALEANALVNLGFACLNLSRSEKAAEDLELALAFHREMKNRADEAFVLSVLGKAYSRLSRYETSIEYYERSKSLPNVFGGVELLTLSACNTATGGSGAKETL